MSADSKIVAERILSAELLAKVDAPDTGDSNGNNQPSANAVGRRGPTHDELAWQWLNLHPNTCYSIGDFRRYSMGIWELVDDKAAEREILDVLIQNKISGVSPNSNTLKSVKKLAQLLARKDDSLFNADYNLLACRNGTLHIPTLTLRPHSPDDYLLSRAEYDYDPNATCPVWDRVMNESAPTGSSLLLQEYAGYTLTTDMSKEISLWLVGLPGTGKSTIIEGFLTLLGSRCGELSLSQVERSNFGLGGVIGKTLLMSTEQSAKFITETGKINKLISGEPITIDRKFREPVEYRSYAKILWAMNTAPRISDPNDGIFRRAKIIQFEKRPWGKPDFGIKGRIRCEGSGILNWALAGLARLNARGEFLISDEVERATFEYEQHNDIPKTFVSDECVIGTDMRVQSSDLYDSYRNWCLSNGHKPESSTGIASDWKRLGFTKRRGSGGVVWHGVGLLAKKL